MNRDSFRWIAVAVAVLGLAAFSVALVLLGSASTHSNTLRRYIM